MHITSTPTKSGGRGGKLHAKRGTTPRSIVGSDGGVCILIEGDDGRTYRVILWKEELNQVVEAAKLVSEDETVRGV